jgi:hypothetical protein
VKLQGKQGTRGIRGSPRTFVNLGLAFQNLYLDSFLSKLKREKEADRSSANDKDLRSRSIRDNRGGSWCIHGFPRHNDKGFKSNSDYIVPASVSGDQSDSMIRGGRPSPHRRLVWHALDNKSPRRGWWRLGEDGGGLSEDGGG